jgi:aspartate kinase
MKKIKVFKFGGGVLKDFRSLFQLLFIVKEENPEVIVVSAMGKTTNALERLAEGYIKDDKNLINYSFEEIDRYNGALIRSIWKSKDSEKSEVKTIYNSYIEFLKKLTFDKPFYNSHKMIRDRFMVFGEIISSVIVSQFLSGEMSKHLLAMADDFIMTDMNFGSANVLIDKSIKKFKNSPFAKGLKEGIPLVTQGFIGRSATNLSLKHSGFIFYGPTTLGREGSDYSASLIARLINNSGIAEVEEVTLWKDVDGVANRNPKEISDEPLIYLPSMSYQELRSQIMHGGNAEGLVHPKTLNELEPLKIPLRVRSFWNLKNPGTLIS